MRFFASRSELKERFDLLDVLVNRAVAPSRGAISRAFTSFLFASFGSVHHRRFFSSLASFCGAVRDETFFMLVSAPDPIYFFESLGQYNSLECSCADSADDYIRLLSAPPRLGNAADALIESSDRFYFLSSSKAWLIICDRSTGTTTFCFRDAPLLLEFKRHYYGSFYQDEDDREDFYIQPTDELPSPQF